MRYSPALRHETNTRTENRKRHLMVRHICLVWFQSFPAIKMLIGGLVPNGNCLLAKWRQRGKPIVRKICLSKTVFKFYQERCSWLRMSDGWSPTSLPCLSFHTLPLPTHPSPLPSPLTFPGPRHASIKRTGRKLRPPMNFRKEKNRCKRLQRPRNLRRWWTKQTRPSIQVK